MSVAEEGITILELWKKKKEKIMMMVIMRRKKRWNPKTQKLGNESNENVMENEHEQDMYTALVNSNVVLIVIL